MPIGAIRTLPPIYTKTDSKAFLKHEITKEWRHINYDEIGENLICTCVKIGKFPCPKHEKEWNEIYIKDTGGIIDSTAELVVDLLDKIQVLEDEIKKLKEKIK